MTHEHAFVQDCVYGDHVIFHDDAFHDDHYDCVFHDPGADRAFHNLDFAFYDRRRNDFYHDHNCYADHRDLAVVRRDHEHNGVNDDATNEQVNLTFLLLD